MRETPIGNRVRRVVKPQRTGKKAKDRRDRARGKR